MKVNGLFGIFVDLLFTQFCLGNFLGLLVFCLYIMLFYIEILWGFFKWVFLCFLFSFLILTRFYFCLLVCLSL